MDWTLAVTRNHAMLMRLLVVLSEMICARMPREVYARALRLMRPAESALRRLIVIAARGMRVAARPARAFPAEFVRAGQGQDRVPCFPLFDPRLHPGPPKVRGGAPNIRTFDAPWSGSVEAVGEVDAAALNKRVMRFRRALDNVQAQARRLVRWRLRHADDVRRPMRPGRPPGHRARPAGAVDYLLRDLQQLALLSYIDTS